MLEHVLWSAADCDRLGVWPICPAPSLRSASGLAYFSPQLFTAFHRGDVLPNQKGLGLGLYISQAIARAHGGAIVANSSPRDTTFTATFAKST